MKKMIATTLVLMLPAVAWAGDVTIKNEDSSAHDLKIKCSSTSTRTIQASTVIKVKDGCTVTVDGSDTETVSSGQSCKIKGGDLTCS